MIRNETVLMCGAFIFHHNTLYQIPSRILSVSLSCFHPHFTFLHAIIGTIPIELPALILYYKWTMFVLLYINRVLTFDGTKKIIGWKWIITNPKYSRIITRDEMTAFPFLMWIQTHSLTHTQWNWKLQMCILNETETYQMILFIYLLNLFKE